MAVAYETVIGLEVHAQLLTESKLFCACPTAFGAEPNALTCPVCLALPGSLPSPNGKAVELALRAVLALGCQTVRTSSQFARKNYFYPDLPKGYQISQYELPIGEHGHLDVECRGGRLAERRGTGVGGAAVRWAEHGGHLTHAAGHGWRRPAAGASRAGAGDRRIGHGARHPSPSSGVGLIVAQAGGR